MISLALLLALLPSSQAAPDDIVAIRCVGSEELTDETTSRKSQRSFEVTLILNEHDRFIAKWDETMGRDVPLCESSAKSCIFDFAPATIDITSDISTYPYWSGWINRTNGRYVLITLTKAKSVVATGTCTKAEMPKFDTATRAF